MNPILQQLQKNSRLLIDAGTAAILFLGVLVVVVVDREANAVDIVFILDQRPEMRDVITGMKANCIEKAESLHSSGMDCRYCVIPIGQNRHRVPAVPLTSDLQNFKGLLSGIPRTDAPQENVAKTPTEAIKQALGLQFRKGAQVLFFLISKSPLQQPRDAEEVARQIAQRRISVIVQSEANEREKCKPLYEGGRFVSMEGVDLTGADGKTGNRNNSRATNLLTQPGRRSTETTVASVKGLYGLRNHPERQKLIKDIGGTPESELAVQAGLDWLARHQSYEGYWSDEGKCEADKPCSYLKYNARIAETGLAILAFQAGGNYYFNTEEYSINVRRGLDWLASQQVDDGRLSPHGQTIWYQHGIGTFALAEACALAVAEGKPVEPRYFEAAKRAVEFMERNQCQSGGWQYNSNNPSGHGTGDTSVTGWQLLALKSAQMGKIPVKPQTMERVIDFYKSCGNAQTGMTGYQSSHSGSNLTTAVGLIVQQFIVKTPDSLLAKNAIKHLQRSSAHLGAHGDYYTLYNATLGMFLAGGDDWKNWNRDVRDSILRRQEKSGCARGSWNNDSRSAGTEPYYRTLNTAWAVLTLEVYYRYTATAAHSQAPEKQPSVKE